VKIGSYNNAYIGCCTDDFPKSGTNLGGDINSWAYDGSSQYKYHAGNSTYWGQYWSAGDHIGVAVDLENKKINYFRNGSDLGTAFENFSIGDGVYPAASLASGQNLTFSFGKTRLQHPHPDSEFRTLHCVLSEQDLANLGRMFNQYKAVGVSLSESGETGDAVKGQGLLEYGQALGVTEDTDPGLLIVLWKLGSRTQWEVSRDEFVDGWTVYAAANINAHKNKLTEWRAELDQVEPFRRFYFWLFDYLKEEQKTILLIDEVTTIWGMLKMETKWPAFWTKWMEYVVAAKVRSISKDTWRQFYDFIRSHPTTLDDYDDMSSWPVVIDEFVIWTKTGKMDGEE